MQIPKGASWLCIDCGFDTAPGCWDRKQWEQTFNVLSTQTSIKQNVDYDSELYMVKATVWHAAGMEDFGGCLCIGCIEKRLGRTLKPRDFMRRHIFNTWPGTDRLLSRRGDA